MLAYEKPIDDDHYDFNLMIGNSDPQLYPYSNQQTLCPSWPRIYPNAASNIYTFDPHTSCDNYTIDPSMFQNPQGSASTVITISPKEVDLTYSGNLPMYSQSSMPQDHLGRASTIESSPIDMSRASTMQSSPIVMSRASTMQSSPIDMSRASTMQSSPIDMTISPKVVDLPLESCDNFWFTQPCISQPFYFWPEDCPQTNMMPTGPMSYPMLQPQTKLEIPNIRKPEGTQADTGTYSCTYHGCPIRFESPLDLQRHKRECHRNPSAATIAAGKIGIIGGGMTSALQRNSQAGPHKCTRTNPSTEKPCNVVFSRPYDLTRHEHSVHNTKKKKVRCPLCKEPKSFSRNDALTRHMRIVHPDAPIEKVLRRRKRPN
ncbi:hypothetical protein K3495_g9291 [Podosphaera aphanis]|nr:hypothetical protein K3495_g9291 [Podosphaera aphanis]